MASVPPEVPAQPTSPAEPTMPGQGDAPAPEITTPGPDIDVPAPQPGGDPGSSPAQPMGFAKPSGATSSDVGARQPGDDGDIGSTDRMGSAYGDMAGTSR